MVCTFFGHRDAPQNIKAKLENQIRLLINNGVKQFLVGNNGFFDFLVQAVLEDISKVHSNINYSIVLSRINEQAAFGNQNLTLFPEGLENVPPRFAICKRNNWLIANSDIAIVYTINKHSNAYKWTKKALSKGMTVINLANEK